MIPRRRIHTTNDEWPTALRVLWGKGSSSGHLRSFEAAFAALVGVKSAIAVGSGRQGMRLILRALRLKEGDEVIVPAYTLRDLIGIIQDMGLVAVAADIERHSFNIDPIDLRKKIRDRTKVILATHLFGTPCRIDEIVALAQEKSIAVIEDCAHAAGVKFANRQAGSFGRAAFFSLESIKTVNTYGGGMIVTDDPALAERIRRDMGQQPESAGLPLNKMVLARLENMLLPSPLALLPLYLLSSQRWSNCIHRLYRYAQRPPPEPVPLCGYQALLGLRRLATLQERVRLRQSLADAYRSRLDVAIEPQAVPAGASASYYFFVCLLPHNANGCRRFLLRHGIDAGVDREIADECASFLGQTDCPNAREVFARAIQLPLYEGLSFAKIERITGFLNRYVKRDERTID